MSPVNCGLLNQHAMLANGGCADGEALGEMDESILETHT